MALMPLLGALGRRLATKLYAERVVDPELSVRPSGQETQAIIVGYGRVGKVVCSLLTTHGLKYIAVDHEAAAVARDHRDGHKVYYGDATEPGFLEACGLMQTTGADSDRCGRQANPRGTAGCGDCFMRAGRRPCSPSLCDRRDRRGARNHRGKPAAFRSGARRFRNRGRTRDYAIASVHEKRDEFRHALQQAARTAGREETRSAFSRR